MALRRKKETQMGIRGKLGFAVGVGLLVLAGWTLGSPQVAQAATLRHPASTAAGAAVAPDVYKVTYFSITDFGDGSAPGSGPNGDARIRIVNPTEATLCAEFYVFDSDEQLAECCGCPVTANGYRQLEVSDNLLGNSLTGSVSDANCTSGDECGTIQVVVSAQTVSDATDPTGGHCSAEHAATLTPGLRLWIVHEEALEATPFTINTSVEEFADAPLSQLELSNLETECSFIPPLGSGFGICSCGRGDVVPPPSKAHRG